MGSGLANALEGGGAGLAQGFQQGYAIGQRNKELRQRAKEREEDVAFRKDTFELQKQSDAQRLALAQFQADTQRILADDQITSGERQRQLEERRLQLNEELGRGQLEVQKGGLAETARSNKAGEKLGKMRLKEERAGRDQAAFDRQQDRNAQFDLQNQRITAQRQESEAERLLRRQLATEENAARLLADREGREFSREMRLTEMLYGDQAEFTKNMIGLSAQLAEGEAAGAITSDQRASFLADALRLRAQLGPAVVGRLQLGDQQGAAREMDSFVSRFQDSVSRKRAEGMPEPQAVAAAMAEVSRGQKPKGTLRAAGGDPYMEQARALLGGGGGGSQGRVQAPPADLSEIVRRAEQAGLKNSGVMSQALGSLDKDASPQDVVDEMNTLSGGSVNFMVDPKSRAPIEAPTPEQIAEEVKALWGDQMDAEELLLSLRPNKRRIGRIQSPMPLMQEGDEELLRDIAVWVDEYYKGRDFVGTELVAKYIAAHAPSLFPMMKRKRSLKRLK